MARKYDVPTDLSISDLGLTLEDLRDSGLDELAKTGARLILEVALREEVLDLLGRDRYERGGEDVLPGYLNDHRMRVVGRFPKELSALTLVFATLEQDRLKWRGVRMDDELQAEIDSARRTAKEKNVFTIDTVDRYLEAV